MCGGSSGPSGPEEQRRLRRKAIGPSGWPSKVSGGGQGNPLGPACSLELSASSLGSFPWWRL